MRDARAASAADRMYSWYLPPDLEAAGLESRVPPPAEGGTYRKHKLQQQYQTDSTRTRAATAHGVASMSDIGTGSYTRPPQRAAGTLRLVIKAAKRTTRENLADLTVLSASVDPYRLDTPAGHRTGRWFAEQVERFVPGDGTIHLRGLHYRISSIGTVVKWGGTMKTMTTTGLT
jgi:hypothetical protein